MKNTFESMFWYTTMISCLLWCGAALAQTVPFAAAMNPGTNHVAAPLEVNADSLEHDRVNGRIVASGNVSIANGADRLRADRVLVNINTGDAYAVGNVVLERDGAVLRGETLHYNLQTRRSSLDTPHLQSEPFDLVAETFSRIEENTYHLRKARITTCEYGHDHPHYHIRARHLEVIPGEHFKARHAVWYFGSVPVFYVPYWRRLLHDEYGWRFYPGYRSRWGGYLYSSFFHRVTPNLRLQHHVDLYSERGVGLGEDVDWRLEGGNGQLSLYYINDRNPLGRNPPADAPEIDKERYRAVLRHDQQFDSDTRFMTRNEYVSDIALRREFFDRDYRRMRQPDNYVNVSHQQERFTLAAAASYRLNDFYESVNRLPELSLNWFRMQLGDSSLYYESESTLAYLNRVYAQGGSNEDYSSFRVDSLHTLYQPRRLAGWLNVVPRASYRGTYYSNTRSIEDVSGVSVRSVTNEVTLAVQTVTETNMTTRVTDGGAKFRQILEVGSEVSFKAFKRLQDSPGGQPWRHVVEPYLNYTMRLEPTIMPEELYQYDGVDSIRDQHAVLIGLRNLLQTKWDNRSVEAVDIDVFTTANLDTDKDEDMLTTLGMKSRFRPSPWMRIDADGNYDMVEGELAVFNSRLTMLHEDVWQFGLEHRFRSEASNQVILDTTFSPNMRWAFNIFSRYEFELSRLEEQGGYFQRNFDCMVVRLGGSVLPGYTRTDGTDEDTDFRVLLAFWLTDYPDAGFMGSGR